MGGESSPGSGHWGELSVRNRAPGPASSDKLGSSCEGSEDKRAGEVLLFTLPPIAGMASREASSVEG